MSEKQEILDSLRPLFERARKDGLWFHCGYQALWFSPDELEKANAEGRFIWGPINWTLRDPQEHVAYLARKVVGSLEEVRRFEERL